MSDSMQHQTKNAASSGREEKARLLYSPGQQTLSRAPPGQSGDNGERDGAEDALETRSIRWESPSSRRHDPPPSLAKLKLHHGKKTNRNERANKGAAASFHPPILFCGECSACAAPPPPISLVPFTAAVDEESARGVADERTSARFIRLRVYNAGGGGAGGGAGSNDESEEEAGPGRAGVLKTILEDLDGVKSVAVSNSYLPPREEREDEEKMIDPNSCTLEIEYCDSRSPTGDVRVEAAATEVVTDNPQETNEDVGEDPVRRAVLARLSEAGFDYAVLSKRGDGISIPNGSFGDDSALLSPSDNDPPTSSRLGGTVSCRTRLRVQGICCMSEVPAVRSILKPLPGVRKLGINVATKVVFVDHDPAVISAALLAVALNDEKFGAEVLTDGGLELLNVVSSTPRDEERPSSDSDPESIRDLPRSRFVESTFVVPGIITYTGDRMESCPIGRLLRQNFFKDHLRAFHLHAPSRTLKVEHDPDLLGAERITDVLVRGLQERDWGTVELVHDGAAEGLVLPVLGGEGQAEGEDGLGEREGRNCCQGLKINVIVSGMFWVVSLLSFVGGPWEYLKYAGIVSVIFGMPPVLMKAWKTICRMQFDANCMMVTAAFGALLLGEFDEAASVAFLFSVSEWIEARATRKGRRALREIISLRPDYANVVDPNLGIIIVPAANIPVGTQVSVRTGDKVPADGIVVEGTSSVDESSLTGEARHVDKRAGDDVSGGSINVGSTQLVVRTTTTVGDSTLSRLIQLVEEAQANTSETEKLVDTFAQKYTPVMLSVALLICTVPWFFGEEVGRYWMLNGLIFIVIACPCALTISTPVTYSAGLAAAARRGIIIKGGNKLEALGNVKTVLFDKTGTVTTGRFSLSHLDLVGNSKSRKEILELLAIMEGPSSHPLSSCLVSAAKEEGVVGGSDVSLSDHTILQGEGVSANIDNKKVYVGNERLFRRLNMYNIPSQHVESANQWSEEGGTVGYCGIEGLGVVGMFCVTDTIRDEAQEVISSLHLSGIDVRMLTGDGEGAAKAVGKEVGLSEACIQSQLLPEDKLHFISGLKESVSSRHTSLWGKQNLILMVGDGVNDAPALAVADVGVAMGEEGASLAMEMSDVTLMDSNLSKLLFSMAMGAKVVVTVKENIAFTMVVNFVAIVLTLMGKMTLLWAIVSDVGVMLLVTLNGMKLLSTRTIDSIEGKLQTRACPLTLMSPLWGGLQLAYHMPPTIDPEPEII